MWVVRADRVLDVRELERAGWLVLDPVPAPMRARVNEKGDARLVF